jgi:hypothetical protein
MLMVQFFSILYLAFLGIGIYVLYLVIKALRIYIRKNSDY